MILLEKCKKSRFGQWCAEHHRKAVTLFVCGGAGFLLLAGAAVATALYFHSILPSNASFCNIPLGGMNLEEVTAVVENEINPRFSDASVSFLFQGNSYPVEVSQTAPYYRPEDVFHAAKECNYSAGEQPEVPLCYDADIFTQLLDALNQTARVNPTPYSYQQQGDTLLLKAGAPGVTFDMDAARQDILNSVQSAEFPEVTAQEEPLTDDSIPINLDAIHDEIAHPVKNADYTISSSGKLTYNNEITGVDFDMDLATEIVSDPNSGEYQVPLIITPPSITVSRLKEEHDNASCPSQLSTYSTTYSLTDEGRVYNIQKAAASINGLVLYPGEAFSFQDTVGPAGKEQGYRESTIYTTDGLDTGYGGGICQVSTTIYLAALYGYFPITERHNHSYTVDYVPLGFDAAVSWGGPDLKFKNNRPNPVKIVASTGTGSITISIFGTPSEYDDYQVSMTSSVTSTTPAPTKQVETSELPQGAQRVKTKGKDGCTVNAHKVVTRDGQVVEEEDIHSYYKPITKVIEIGTGPA